MDYSGWDPSTSTIAFEFFAVVSISCKKQELLLIRVGLKEYAHTYNF